LTSDSYDRAQGEQQGIARQEGEHHDAGFNENNGRRDGQA
jgi:hypothetical protein